MPTQDTQERREYYRIRDRIALQINDVTTGAPDDSVLFALLNELYLLDLESRPLLRSISEKQRALVSYLQITNKRIDLLANALAQGLLRQFGEPRNVVLSEDGISFDDDRPHTPGGLLDLKLILLPQAFGLQLQARIVQCQEQDDGRFRLSLQFRDISETQRQVLARHIMQKQAQERRNALAGQEEP